MARLLGCWSAALLTVGTCLTACTRTTEPTSSVTIVDSAGVQIVENISPVWDSTTAWRVSERPSLQLGVVAGREEELFDRIADVALPGDGSIWVANSGDETIRIFDMTGAHIRTLGGAGQGPGEFTVLTGLSVSGNSIYADQGFRFPLAKYAIDGSLQATTQLIRHSDLPAPAVVGIVTADRSASAVVMHRLPAPRSGPTGLFEQETPVYLLPLDGGEPVELGVFPAARFFGVAGASRWQEFTPFLQVATCANRIFIGWPETSEIREYTLAGRLNRIIRWDRIPAPVIESQRQSSRDRLLIFPPGAQVSERSRTLKEAIANGMIFPEQHPSYRRVLCDSERRIWLEQETLDPLGASLQWDIIDQDGRWLGSLQTPQRFIPMAISSDLVAGRYLSDRDVQFVRIYSLLQPQT